MRVLPLVTASLAISILASSPVEAARRARAAAKPAAPAIAVPVFVSYPEQLTPESNASVPITFGVPFPRGALRPGAALAARPSKSAKQLHAVQTRPLSTWPDGTVRWALIDWQIDSSEPSAQRFELVLASKAQPPRSSVRFQQGKAGISVDTGAIQFSVPLDHFAILENVRLNNAQAFAGTLSAAISGDQEEWAPQAPTSLKVLEAGPQRVRIESRGTYTENFEYVIRIDAYAGQSWVRVHHTFEQHSAQAYLPVREISLRMALPEAESVQYVVGIEGGPARKGRVNGGALKIIQTDNETLSIQGDEQAAKASGWINVSSESGSVSVAAPYFWQEYPQGFTLEGSRLTYDLLSAHNRPIPVGMGAAKTHEFVVAFDRSAPTAAALDALAHPPTASVDAKWIDASGALRNSIVRNPTTNVFVGTFNDTFHTVELRNSKERWDDAGEVRCVGDEKPRVGAYGMFNWGDWNYPGYHDDTKGCDAWGNQEYDLTQVYALGYAASGDPRMRRAMMVAARHFMDVDVVHYQDQRSDWVGMNHPKNPLHFAFELGGVDLGHTWVEGLFSAYFFSGDERALEAARGIADYLVRRTQRGVVKGNPRQFGWPQIALVAAFEATGESHYRDAALWYAQRGMSAHEPDKIDDWKLGILAEALAYTDSATGNAEVRSWLKRYSAAAIERGARDPRFFPALAYIGRVENDAAATKAALRAAGQLRLGSWAKPFTIASRIGFAIYSQAE